jgi:peptide methionine sulfoxide reductase MsrA
LGLLFDLLFRTIDSSTENWEKHDLWSHSHTGIFYTSENQLSIVNLVLDKAAKRDENPLVVEEVPFEIFTVQGIIAKNTWASIGRLVCTALNR